MDIRHLKMVTEVAHHGNLTKAAEQLYVSQSALSHQLKELELFFGTQVFIRQKKQMVLTQSGKLILATSQKIMDDIEAAKKEVSKLTQKDAGEIRLSTECYTSYHWLSGFLKEFKTLFPKVEVLIHSEATYHAVSCLLENRIDVGITEDNLNPKLNYTALFKDEFVAITAPDHPWAKLKQVQPEQFLQENYIMYNIPNEMSTIVQLLFKKEQPKKIYKITLTEAIIQMVKAGIGVSVLPHWIVAPYVHSGEIAALPITSKGIKRTWYAATLKNKELPSYTSQFIRNLSKHLKNSETLEPLAPAK
jgi:LysR family transcriptional regulator for metE and metH